MRVRSIFKRAVMSALLIAGQIAAQGAQAGSSIKIIPQAKGSALQTDNAADGTDDYSTDARLVSYVVDRVILRNGLIVRRWRWTPEAKALRITVRTRCLWRFSHTPIAATICRGGQ